MAIGAFLWVRTRETPRPATSSFLRPDDIPYHRYHRYPTLPAQVLSRALALLPLADYCTIAFISFAYLLHIVVICICMITYKMHFFKEWISDAVVNSVDQKPQWSLGDTLPGSRAHSTQYTGHCTVDPWPPAISIIPL